MNKLDKSREINLLHPKFREAVIGVLTELHNEKIPFAIFEGYRYPERQKILYNEGRDEEGNVVDKTKIITKASPWNSLHQWGFAADFVLYENKKWSWSTEKPLDAWWKRLHEIGTEHGLVHLSYELPHLQLAGISLKDLKEGIYPNGGDDSWLNNLLETLGDWVE